MSSMARGFGAVCVLCCSGWLAAATAACLNPKVLQMAVIPKNVRNAQVSSQSALLQSIQEESGKAVELLPATSYAAVIENLLAGKAHIAELGPASYALLSKRAPHFVPFATLSRSRQLGQYHSLLVVRGDAIYQSLLQLRGKSLALTDPSSTSGAVVPGWMVQKATGYALTHYFSRVLFMGSHDRALEAVRKGWVEAAFVASDQMPEDDKNWRVLWRSPALVGSPFVMDARLCPAIQAQVRQAFLERQERLQAWLQMQHYQYVVPVTAEDYAGVQALIAPPADGQASP